VWQHSTYILNAFEDERLGPVGVMHIPAAVQNSQHLSGLRDRTEQRVVTTFFTSLLHMVTKQSLLHLQLGA
jgi:hypothetical protein